jgi:LuxR family transcriptional regulator, maltose regulon positive regulatory protein
LSDLQYVYPLIHNKVTSPHYVTPTLRRPRLLDWLNANSRCRAVVVAADAGYGKTTLIWQWEREVDFPCYWYKLDRNDRDWSLHISYLIEAISQQHPGFGQRAHSMLQQLGGPGSSRPGVAAYLLAEMYERLTEPCTFIIDDWQFVASVTEVRGLWNQILRDAPPTCRFIFLSRAKPQLQFARFKTHSGYAEMRTDALRFTDSEIGQLFRDIYNDPLDPTELAELERRTEGWAASLQLVEVSLRERRTAEERDAFIRSITATKDSDLVEFLAQEVLEQQTTAVKNFLLSTSVLLQIPPELAARLAGVTDGEKVLDGLERDGLFTFRLNTDESLYRYHNLFRDFLERRLSTERTDGEVAALHIHAASYFETHSHWPEAIHHYMRAGLQPQAARLIAKYGEDVMAGGRLPLVDEWIGKLPRKTVRENARLSLLHGEAMGVRGDWESALASLQRARHFFARKGDRRMEAIACSKLSTFYNNLGDVGLSASAAREGMELSPEDDHRTRLRLQGNLATTTTWLESLPRAELECKRVAVESTSRGYEQYAAIAHHNLGMMLRYAGRLEESLHNLERAAQFWNSTPTNPFADNSELVQTLLLVGNPGRAEQVAAMAVERTRPWPKPNGEALFGSACVLAHAGRFAEAADILRNALQLHGNTLGPVSEKALAVLVECLYLDGSIDGEIAQILRRLEETAGDPRLAPVTSVGRALAAHRSAKCLNHCRRARATLAAWERNGASLIGFTGRVRLAVLAFEHDPQKGAQQAAEVLARHIEPGVATHLRWWFRAYAPHLPAIWRFNPNTQALISLLKADPDHWVAPIGALIPEMPTGARAEVLDAIRTVADVNTAQLLRTINGSDVHELRRELMQRFATRLSIRSFGTIVLHRGGWEGPGFAVTRRRSRLLLGVLIAHQEAHLTRDQVLDILWPDADAASAINSLNQTVFQLRRLINPAYREGDSPQYIVSTADAVHLNEDLVETDLGRFRTLASELASAPTTDGRTAIIEELIDLVRGEFLGDLKYEDWASDTQTMVHSEVRRVLLPIALGSSPVSDQEFVLRAGMALSRIDPYDETAQISMARHLADSGRRNQGKLLIERFTRRLREDLEEDPSEEVRVVATLLGSKS